MIELHCKVILQHKTFIILFLWPFQTLPKFPIRLKWFLNAYSSTTQAFTDPWPWTKCCLPLLVTWAFFLCWFITASKYRLAMTCHSFLSLSFCLRRMNSLPLQYPSLKIVLFSGAFEAVLFSFVIYSSVHVPSDAPGGRQCMPLYCITPQSRTACGWGRGTWQRNATPTATAHQFSH